MKIIRQIIALIGIHVESHKALIKFIAEIAKVEMTLREKLKWIFIAQRSKWRIKRVGDFIRKHKLPVAGAHTDRVSQMRDLCQGAEESYEEYRKRIEEGILSGEIGGQHCNEKKSSSL